MGGGVMKIGPVHKLALFYIESVRVGEEFPHSFWKNSYGCRPKTLINNLSSKDYITEGFNLKNILNKLTVQEIEEVLRKHHLSLSGERSELVKRVQENADILDYASLPKYYVLTSKGKNLRDRSHHILYFHENDFDINIFKADKIYSRHKKFSSKEIIEKILKDGFTSSLRSENYHNAYYYSNRLARFYEVYNMTEEEMRAITVMMACNIRQAFKHLEVPNFKYRDSYGSELIGNDTDLENKFKTISSKWHSNKSQQKNYIIETLGPILKNDELNSDTANIIIWSLNNEEEHIDKFIKDKFHIESRKQRNYELKKKIELYKELNKTNPQNDKTSSAKSPKKGVGCLSFLLLPGFLAVYGIVELLNNLNL